MTFALAGGLAVGLAPVEGVAAAPLSPWIAIAPDGTVTLTSPVLEMGQGARTGLVQILACELDADWDRIKVAQAPEAEPFLLNGALYSGGSETLRLRYDLLRRAAATVRAQLVAAAARRWGVELGACRTSDGAVLHAATGRRLDYGALVADAARIAPPAEAPLKPAAERRYVGRSLPTLDQADKVTGKARYGLDFRLPGMRFATLRQCPRFGGELESVDEAPALAVRGVRRVVRLKDAVAVVADSTWAAFKGARALEPRWRAGLAFDQAELPERLAAAIDDPKARVLPREGGAAARARLRETYASASRRHEATYDIAYLAHATMEPMNAVARADANRAEIWAPCQSPTWLRDDVAAMTGLPKTAITVHPLLMGGGFGRRLKGDYAGRAVQVAQAIGEPVQMVWTREEDFTHDVYRPAMRMTLRTALPPDGMLSGYEVLTSTTDDWTGGHRPAPYRIAGYAATLGTAKVGVPVGSWRAVDPGMSLFAKESFIDECAHLAGIDPLEYRERLLGDHARARRVLRAAAVAVGWDIPRPEGCGVGYALLEDWDSVVAHAIEVEVEGDRLRVTRIAVAADVGLAINPQQVRAQFEGGSLMALSAALSEEMTFKGGQADQANFTDYPVLRMSQVPRVDLVLFDTPGAKVGGVGEPPVPGVAPALANALFAATGRRVRELPLRRAGFQV